MIDPTTLISQVLVNAGTHYVGDILQGTVDVEVSNISDIEDTFQPNLIVKLLDHNGIMLNYAAVSIPPVVLQAHQTITLNQTWYLPSTEADPDNDCGAGYCPYTVRVEKVSDPFFYDDSLPFDIYKVLASGKNILGFSFLKSNNPGLILDCYGTIDHTLETISLNVPSGTVLTALIPDITISYSATILPTSGTAGDFSSSVLYIVTAEDLTTKQYTVTVTVDITPAVVFVYDDNDLTWITPIELEPGGTLQYNALLSNSGDSISVPTNLTIEFRNQQQTYVKSIDVIVIPSLTKYEDYLVTGSYVLPSDVPKGDTYYLDFKLDYSTVSRSMYVSEWDVSAVSLKFNEKLHLFHGESTIISRFYINIGTQFITNLGNSFYEHNESSEFRLYGNDFEPTIEFVINKYEFTKVFDDLIINMNSVGLKQIEYWTQNQYSKHTWPLTESSVQAQPWIDPEFKEDKWYLPISPEKVNINAVVDGIHIIGATQIKVVDDLPDIIPQTGSIYINDKEYTYSALSTHNTFTLDSGLTEQLDDQDPIAVDVGFMADVNYMRGQWLIVKFTFKSLNSFSLRDVIAIFNQSKI